VRAALSTSRLDRPDGRVTINLAPADLPKESGRFDLPIAIGILAATRQVPAKALARRALEVAAAGAHSLLSL
jgi:magnesium chelatase family protein